MTDRPRRTGSRAPAHLVISASLPRTAEGAGEARALVGRACREWGLAHIEVDAKMVVSELVENAIRHGGGPGDIRLVLDDLGLTVSVADHVASPPRLTHPRIDQQGGRGLLLVNGLSERWGYRRTHAGKVVWARLRV